jgi:hypothetical protein
MHAGARRTNIPLRSPCLGFRPVATKSTLVMTPAGPMMADAPTEHNIRFCPGCVKKRLGEVHFRIRRLPSPIRPACMPFRCAVNSRTTRKSRALLDSRRPLPIPYIPSSCYYQEIIVHSPSSETSTSTNAFQSLVYHDIMIDMSVGRIAALSISCRFGAKHCQPCSLQPLKRVGRHIRR